MIPFKPLLAAPVDFKHLDYSNTWISPKLDGIRAIIIKGVVMSRTLKPIPNAYVQALYGNRPELEGFDGELIVGPANASDVYTKTYSGVMKESGEPDVTFHVFDHIGNPCDEYFKRFESVQAGRHRGVEIVPQHGVMCEQDVIDIEQMYLEKGYEGVMLRAHSGPSSFYKYGRSTAKACTLLKLKRFTDGEARIVGFEEQMHNGNEATKDELGRTKRSSHAENKTGMDTLGALVCVDVETGVKFNIGTGFDYATRQDLWNSQETLLGSLVKYKSFLVGVVDAPRFPVYLGLRSPIDCDILVK